MSYEQDYLLMLTDDQIDYGSLSDPVLRQLALDVEPYIAQSALTELLLRESNEAVATACHILSGTLHQLRLPEIGPYGLELSELEIHLIQEQMMEGLNFHVEDFADDGMSCDCREVRFVRVGKLEWNESESVLWATDHVNGTGYNI